MTIVVLRQSGTSCVEWSQLLRGEWRAAWKGGLRTVGGARFAPLYVIECVVDTNPGDRPRQGKNWSQAKEHTMAKPKHDKQREENESRRERPIAPYSPLGMSSLGLPLARLRSEVERLFDDFFRGWGGLPALRQGWEWESGWGLDVEDQEDKIIVRAEAPGFEPEDFDLEVRDNQLVLRACQSKEKVEEGGRHWRRQELYRSVPLPASIDEQHIDARYRNGILTVTLPKTEQSKRRRIEVKS